MTKLRNANIPNRLDYGMFDLEMREARANVRKLLNLGNKIVESCRKFMLVPFNTARPAEIQYKDVHVCSGEGGEEITKIELWDINVDSIWRPKLKPTSAIYCEREERDILLKLSPQSNLVQQSHQRHH